MHASKSVVCRRLHGRRGLKYDVGKWDLLIARRRLHGRRGLKYDVGKWDLLIARRRLHGRRGLKYHGQSKKPLKDIVAAFTGGVD